ncbi:uncharacterized protein LOC124805939 [Hydra vulgaris]|uniref:uncharacterized protein LOC124805939 n=1 Tax=Hydra vulgaris TaxID=6087 RepID=UPI0032E9EBBE
MDDFGDQNPSTDEVSKFALNYIEGNTDGKRKHSDGDQFSDSENIAPVSEHTGLNGPKYKSSPKSKVLKKKHVNEVLNENSAILIEQKKLLFEQKKTNKLLSEILKKTNRKRICKY